MRCGGSRKLRLIAVLRNKANVRRLGTRNARRQMIYELRIYHCVTGRLPTLLKRFETTTLELWKRHGIRQAGFWTVLVGDGGKNQDLHYLLAWQFSENGGARDQMGMRLRATRSGSRSAPRASATAPSSPRSRTCSCSRPPSRRSSDAPDVPRGLDHIVHAVRDLDVAADLYRCSVFSSARATGMPGAPTIVSCNCRASSSSC